MDLYLFIISLVAVFFAAMTILLLFLWLRAYGKLSLYKRDRKDGDLRYISHIFESWRGGIIILDSDLKPVSIKFNSEKLRNISSANIAKILNTIANAMNDCDCGGKKAKVVVKLKSAEYAYLSLNILPMYPQNRAGKSCIVFIKDSTKEHLKSEQIEISKSLMLHASATVGISFFRFDKVGGKLVSSPIGMPSFKYCLDENNLPTTLENWLDAESVATFRNSIDRLFGNQTDSVSIKIRTKNSANRGYFTMSAERFVRKIGDTDTVFVAGVVQDVTEQEKNRIAMLGQQDSLSYYNKTLQEFITQDKIQKDCLTELLVDDGFQASFQKIAGMVGNYLNCGMIELAKYVGGKSPCVRGVSFWNKDLAKSKFNYDKILESDFPATFAHLKAFNIVHMSLSMPEPQDKKSWQYEIYKYIRKSRVENLICLPIKRDGKFWGFFGTEIKDLNSNFETHGMRMIAAATSMVEILLSRQIQKDLLTQIQRERQLIIEMLPIPIVLMDTNAFIIHANPAFNNMVGHTAMPLVGHNCRGDICKVLCTPQTCPLTLTVINNGPTSFEKKMPNGRTYLINTMPVHKDGECDKIVVAYIDLTEMEKSRKMMKLALEQAQEAAKMKSVFLATMSHEIRTPLNSIIGFSELLGGSNLPDSEKNDYINSISLAGKALLNLINDILDISKLESGKMIISNPDKVDFEVLLKELVAIFKLEVKEKNIDMKVSCDNLPRLLGLHLRQIRQVLLNLIGNSVNFTREGRIDISTDFERQTISSGTLRIIISDTGVGISAEALPKIFEPFVQDERIRDTRNQSGTGLGLPIAKRLIEAMNGTISVRSQLGKGSQFTIILDNIPIYGNPQKREKQHTHNSLRTNGKIMLLDDVPMNVKVLGAILKRLGNGYDSSNSPEEVLLVVPDGGYSLLFTDLWMPKLNGVEVASFLRKKNGCENLKIVAVTADSDNSVNFDTSVFDAVLMKPVTLDTLKAILAKLKI